MKTEISNNQYGFDRINGRIERATPEINGIIKRFFFAYTKRAKPIIPTINCK